MKTCRHILLVLVFCACWPERLSRAADAEASVEKPFSIRPYQPTFLLPLYYSSTASSTDKFGKYFPRDSSEVSVKFQISLKSPVLKHLLEYDNTVFIGYTQQSYWQAYTDSPFLKTNDFKPELFWENGVRFELPMGWRLQTLTPGIVHHSNGRGSILERSWNRVYVDAQFTSQNWMVGVKPWFIIPESSLSLNPDIEKYLGNGSLLLCHRFQDHVFSLNTYAHVYSSPSRFSGQFTWSFPISADVKGYALAFSGYGQSLLEYNQRTLGFGLGIVFHDWMFEPF